MTTPDENGYPFEEEWQKRQAEPMPNIGVVWKPSPLTKERMPERVKDKFHVRGEQTKENAPQSVE